MEEAIKRAIDEYKNSYQFQVDVYEAMSRELEAGKPLSIGKRTTKDYSAGFALFSPKKGIGFPIMTEAQRDLIADPALGLVIYNTNQDLLNQYTLIGGWQSVGVAVYTTTARNLITAPYFGQVIYNSTTNTLQYFTGLSDDNGWININGSTLPSYTTAQRDALLFAVPGDLIYNTDTDKANLLTATGWEEITST